jgi:hypothetical protein
MKLVIIEAHFGHGTRSEIDQTLEGAQIKLADSVRRLWDGYDQIVPMPVPPPAADLDAVRQFFAWHENQILETYPDLCEEDFVPEHARAGHAYCKMTNYELHVPVHLCIIGHAHGVNFDAFLSIEDSDTYLRDYVDDNWDEEIPDTVERPEDPAERVSVYFSRVSEEEYIQDEAIL